MEQYEIIVVVMLTTFILTLFTGFPVAWLLGGLSFIFAGIGVYGAEFYDLDTYFMNDWSRFANIVQRVWSQMENWVLVALPMFIFMGLPGGITVNLALRPRLVSDNFVAPGFLANISSRHCS